MEYKVVEEEYFKKVKNDIKPIIKNNDYINFIEEYYSSNLKKLYNGLLSKNYSNEIIISDVETYTFNFTVRVTSLYRATLDIKNYISSIDKMEIDYNYIPYQFRRSYYYVKKASDLFMSMLVDDINYKTILNDLKNMSNFYKDLSMEKPPVKDKNYQDKDIPQSILDATKGVE